MRWENSASSNPRAGIRPARRGPISTRVNSLRRAWSAKCQWHRRGALREQHESYARQPHSCARNLRNWISGGAETVRARASVLQRAFDVAHPNKAWATDITYIRTWEASPYLAVVTELFSRKIVGWFTRSILSRDLALDAILMAVRNRHPKDTIIHSDYESQYGSGDWRRF